MNAVEQEERNTRAIIEDLDEQIISMILRRAELARRHQSLRRAAGLPDIELARENEELRRYVARLGRQGAEIARVVLSLSRAPGFTRGTWTRVNGGGAQTAS